MTKFNWAEPPNKIEADWSAIHARAEAAESDARLLKVQLDLALERQERLSLEVRGEKFRADLAEKQLREATTVGTDPAMVPPFEGDPKECEFKPATPELTGRAKVERMLLAAMVEELHKFDCDQLRLIEAVTGNYLRKRDGGAS